MRLGTKFKLILCFYSMLPLGVLYYSSLRSGLINHNHFQQGMSLAVLTALLVPQFATFLPGLGWLIMSQVKAMVTFCNNLKQGKFCEFGLPVELEEENEIISLMRTMNWMARKIKNRESDLERMVDRKTSDLKETNLRLRKSQEAQEASARAKGQFMAGMSHEIRTPINAIIGMAEIGLKDTTDPVTLNRFRIIADASGSLLAMINNVLDFSKMEAGKLSIENRPFLISDLVDDVVEMFGPESREKGLELVAHVEPGLPRELTGDHLRIRQVLTNLISNAVKFTSSGEIVLKVRGSRIEGDSQKIKTEFSVMDTGVGIPREFLGNLFDAFTQADNSTTRRFGGTGLGLAISREIAVLMGGSLTATSEVDMGSQFDFTINLGFNQNATGENGYENNNPGERQALIIEDNPTTQKLLHDIVSGHGFSVEISPGDEEALKNIDDRIYRQDLVVLDSTLPEKGGFQLLEQIENKTSCPPVIFLAGSEEHAKKAISTKIPMACLLKPVKTRTLSTAIKRALCETAPGNKYDKHPPEKICKTPRCNDTSGEIISSLHNLERLVSEKNMKAKNAALALEPKMSSIGKETRFLKIISDVNKYDFRSAGKKLESLIEDMETGTDQETTRDKIII